MDVQAILSGVAIGAGAISIYVKLSLPAYTVKVLNGRYATKELMEARFNSMDKKIDDMKELIVSKLNDLPCASGPFCRIEESHGRRAR